MSNKKYCFVIAAGATQNIVRCEILRTVTKSRARLRELRERSTVE